MNSKPSFTRHLVNTFGMVLVLALSLAMLVYVGYGETYRTYPKFEMDKLAAQGGTIRNSMNTFVLAGLPIEQFPGFLTLTQPLLDSDKSIVAVYVSDASGKVIFANSQGGQQNLIPDNDRAFQISSLQDSDKSKVSDYKITENDTLYRVTLDLKNKTGTVDNSLNLITPKSQIADRINQSFIPAFLAAGGLLLVYSLLAYFLSGHGLSQSRARWLGGFYGLAFLVMAVAVIVTLVMIYTDGIQGKTRALANSLEERLSAPLDLGLDITNFDELDSTLKTYQKSNPDLSYVALTVNNKILIHTDNNLVGKDWQPYDNHFEETVKLNGRGAGTKDIEIHLGIARDVVYNKLWRSVKNFIVLFIASAFLAVLFFNLMRAFINRPMRATGREPIRVMAAEQRQFELNLIRPFYFLSVFVEGLATSFLPQYFQELAKGANADKGMVSAIFTVYFAAFVVVLIPAGRYAERKGIKPLLVAGIFLAAASFLVMAFVTNFYLMFLIRAVAGAAQGILYIGVQSYILEMAAGGQKTRGAAIIVFGYNGGNISGTAIGALLVLYMGVQGVFIVGGLVSLFTVCYAVSLIPKVVPKPDEILARPAKQSFFKQVGNAVKDFEFMKAMLLVGIPAKAVLTGVTIFALPLLLSRLNYAQEDIGQIIMLYAAGVLISSIYIPKLVDKIGKTSTVLFIGAAGSGLGLILIGLIGWEPVQKSSFTALSTVLLMAGMVVLGLAHGFIHAPIVTHVSNTMAARILGQSSAASLYRVLERIGHMAGPIVVSQLLYFNSDSPFAIAWLGFAAIFFGLLFTIRFSRSAPASAQSLGVTK